MTRSCRERDVDEDTASRTNTNHNTGGSWLDWQSAGCWGLLNEQTASGFFSTPPACFAAPEGPVGRHGRGVSCTTVFRVQFQP